jgi:maltose alpha-D-glucosyltransferase / alpha-amylase
VIEDLWYKNAIVYSLDLESFMDGNGDGCGDFEGLTHRLDYLETLGVDVIWLAPFQPSPMKDNGYDVKDFYGVDPRYGSPGAFVELVHQARKRGIRVMMDLVVNHTSDQHPWFKQARSDPGSRYRDWYIWSKRRPRASKTGMVFPGVQHRTWTRDEKAGAYYFHRFYEHQPDLNLNNPEVRTEIRRIIGFWAQQGVNGFRLDAVPFIIESPPAPDGSVEPGKHFEYLEEMRAFLQWRVGDAVLLGEANVLPEETAPYFGEGRGLHLMFNFWVNQHLFLSLARGQAAPLEQALRDTSDIPPTAQWAHFLRNHDELDLGRLSEQERQEVFARFGPEPSMQVYGRGLRRRLGPMLGNELQSQLAYSLLFSLPGTPVLRYGDEIGMGEDLDLPEREAVRTPMQWSNQAAGGFSTAPARRLVHPVIDDGPYSYHHVNVDAQRRTPVSMLQWMGKMIRLRKECLEIGWGKLTIVDGGCAHVLVLRYRWRGTEVLTVHNVDAARHETNFRLEGSEGRPLLDLMEEETVQANADGRYHLALEAFAYRWFRVGTLNYALIRREERPEESQPRTQAPARRRRR